MPSFRRRASATDTDKVEAPPTKAVSSAEIPDATNALALAEEAEAEAAEAEAMAAAARARARAIRLRREAATAGPESANGAAAAVDDEPAPADDDTADEPEPETAVAEKVDAEEPDAVVDEADAESEDAAEEYDEQVAPSGRRWGLIAKIVAMTLAVLCTIALLTVSVLMFLNHRKADDERRMNAEYAAAGRQSVVTLMSLDFNKAQEDVKKIIDNSTGDFKKDFENQAQDFIKVAQDSKVITDVTVTATAVESMDKDKAVVLVAATSRVTNSAGAKAEPRAWRLSVDLLRENGQIKMSKVEFVP